MDCYCDYDPPGLYCAEIRKSRKDRKCYECGGRIIPGEKYERVAATWDGRFDIVQTCERCVDIRTWVKNNVPCFCWAHGNLGDDCIAAVDDAVYRAPDETLGLQFGLRRRFALRDRFNEQRKDTT
jgi:hypothetical protein